MQEVIVNIVILGLFVFLFAVISLVRPDDRLRLWVGGWLCIFAHFAAELWQPAGSVAQNIQACLSIDALALAGISFVCSTMILREGRNDAFRFCSLIAVFTLLCVNLAVVGSPVPGLLAAAVVVRQTVAIARATRHRMKGLPGGFLITLICLVFGAWMLYGAFHAQPDVVVSALLGEIFFVAGVEFFANGLQRTLGLKTMIAGLMAWGAVFPTAYWMQTLWPHLSVHPEIWNIPKFCVAIGMILVVLEEDMRMAQALTEDYRLLFDNNPHALWITEVETQRFLAVNQAALDLHGYTREEFLNLRLPEILDPESREEAIAQLRSGTPCPNRASRHRRKDGSVVPLDLSAHNITFHGTVCRFVMAIDVAEREALLQQLDDQTRHDHLTGLPNRALFPEMLAQAIQRAAVTHQKLAVLSLDFDRFKRVNDVYGLRIGDECIQRVGALIAAGLGPFDLVARTGGDEFTVVLSGIQSTVTVEHTLNELREAFAQPLVVRGYSIQLPLSIGLAISPDNGTDPIALWRGAESACNEAKLRGGGQTVWLSPQLRDAADEAIALEAYMRNHMEEGGFHLAYQPIYGRDGEVHDLEALLRLNHPQFGSVSPARLIPIAENSGLIIPLGQWVLEEVCRQLQTWKSQGMPLVPVAVNISALQLMHVDFARRFMSTLDRFDIDPHWIHLEVTESAAMHGVGEVADQIAALSEQGIAFSIDDFGTGHSSLARLHQLRISELKIDRSFIDQLCIRDGAQPIVQTIITLGHTLGLAVVAEGVETELQLGCLRELGCDLVQGYLLSRPVSPDRIPALIAAAHPAFDAVPAMECKGSCRQVA